MRETCLSVKPELVSSAETAGAVHPHEVACHFPVDKPKDDAALAVNKQAGRAVAGRKLDLEKV